MDNISLFGGSGFIGGRFNEMFSKQVCLINRESRVPITNEILYLISTVDNYNIHSSLHKDIDTNLTVLMDVLTNIKDNEKDVVFNFVSSWFVYGKNEILPFNEERSFCNPTGFYSITKRTAEQMLISFCETFGIRYRIFRLSNVLGEQDCKVSRKKNALQHMIKCLCFDEEIFLYDNGSAVRDYIYVDDACSAMMHCIKYAPTNQIINIANGQPYILGDVLSKARIASNSKSIIHNIQPPHFHDIVQVKDSYLDITKLKSYGFQSQYTIDDMVNKLVAYYTNQKN